MLPNLLRDRIHAEAYRQLREGLAQSYSTEALKAIIRTAEQKVKDQTYDVADTLVRLHASRSTRLPNVQFVHWGDFYWPRIRTASGGEQLLTAQKWCERARPDASLYDHLANVEHTLFGGEDYDVVVFRKTTLLWDPMQPDAPIDDLLFYMEHAVAYIYDGDAHLHPKTAPQGREIVQFDRTLPKRWHPFGSK